ncbi:MAG TPA: amino acid adenylation domain-containing protein [Streptosporangiaceae bacterium]|nr:amino acid adenylation domain-containing protein [Streptosporangiaceae bacterium]
MTDMMKRLASLPEARRAQFLAQLRAQVEGAATRGPRPRRDTGPAPLSHSQETLWFLDKLAPDTPTYSVPLCTRLRGQLDVAALRGALAAVVARHEALRTAIVEHEEGPVQIIAEQVPVELPVRELPPGIADPEAAARALLDQANRTPFDLTRMPLWRAFLIRLAPDDHFFFFNVHHVVFDGWSMGLLSGELAELYRAAVEGSTAELPDLPVQYPDYACWQREWLSGDGLDEQASYWREHLAGAEVLEFPTDRPRGDALTFNGTFESLPVDRADMERAQALAREEGVTPFNVYIAAFLTMLQRYSGLDDLVIGSPNANRRHSSVERVIGYFINMMVLRADLSGNPSFRELVRRLKPVLRDAFVHGDLPFGKLVSAVNPPRDPSRSPIFQIVFTLQNVGSPVTLPGLDVSNEVVRLGTSRFDMSWNLVEKEGDDGAVAIEYNTDLFDADAIVAFAGHFRELLANLTAAPDQPLAQAEMLTRRERAALLAVGSGPQRPVRESTIVAEFEAVTRRTPEATALVCAGRELTYRELNGRANRLAAVLREHGAGPGTTVGLCQRRTEHLTTSMLATLKAGAAYVPLDPTHPPARLATIAADAALAAVIADAGSAAALGQLDGTPVLVLDELTGELPRHQDTDPPLAAGPGDPAYVIYTSGSTGQPKGVLIRHRSVVNFADSTRDLFELTPRDRMLGFASATFDVSVFETFSALLTGAALHLLTDEERLSIDTLQTTLEQAGISVIDLPPTVMVLLAPEGFSDLRIAFVGGEAFSGELVNRWNKGRRLFNGYGPTECTVTMIVEECHGNWDSSPPIGLPMTNHVAHVLDTQRRLLPAGIPGELVIGGAGLAIGYLGSPELTEQKFFDDPFGTAWGDRLYRTGDLVKRLRDGRLVFLGRVDQQVKIRGLRIELGEVESALAACPGLGQVSVQAWADPAGEKHLVGYVTPAAGAPQPDPQRLRGQLADRLPGYMIPSYFVTVPELPLTSSGKVDRRKLPDPDPAAEMAGQVTEPRTDTERVLLNEVLVPLLRNDRVGVLDDFFRAGGNSLQAAQLMSAITRRFSVEVSLADFFASPTVAHLAATVDARRAARLSDDELLDMLENMPDDQVSRLLGDAGAGL